MKTASTSRPFAIIPRCPLMAAAAFVSLKSKICAASLLHAPLRRPTAMKVTTHNDKLLRVRKTVLELLLAYGDHNCLMCEKNGECELQNLVYEHGIDHCAFQNQLCPETHRRLQFDDRAGPEQMRPVRPVRQGRASMCR